MPENAHQPTTSTAPVVEVRGVSYAYGSRKARRQVLFDNSLSLMAGELVIMTGPSGSGKTTLLTLIGALRAIQTGHITVMGHGLQAMNERGLQQVRRHIGFIFQDHNLFESLNAGQTLRLAMDLFPGRYGRDELRERPRALLAELGLEDYLDALPGNLSTGQKQRIAIARALINHPQLILADEPTAALDQRNGTRVLELLRQRAEREGASALIVTHDQRIFDAADRIIRMMDGHIVAED